jgi:hypothetical protein
MLEEAEQKGGGVMRREQLTQKQALKVLHWCAGQLHLEAWGFQFYYQDDPPAEIENIAGGNLGKTIIKGYQRLAIIWVSPARCGNRKGSIEIICHEIVHVFMEDNGCENIGSNQEEHIAYTLAVVLTKAYLAGVKC